METDIEFQARRVRESVSRDRHPAGRADDLLYFVRDGFGDGAVHAARPSRLRFHAELFCTDESRDGMVGTIDEVTCSRCLEKLEQRLEERVMRVPGICTECRRTRRVLASGDALATSLAKNWPVEGICQECEDKRARKLVERRR